MLACFYYEGVKSFLESAVWRGQRGQATVARPAAEDVGVVAGARESRSGDLQGLPGHLCTRVRRSVEALEPRSGRHSILATVPSDGAAQGDRAAEETRGGERRLERVLETVRVKLRERRRVGGDGVMGTEERNIPR